MRGVQALMSPRIAYQSRATCCKRHALSLCKQRATSSIGALSLESQAVLTCICSPTARIFEEQVRQMQWSCKQSSSESVVTRKTPCARACHQNAQPRK